MAAFQRIAGYPTADYRDTRTAAGRKRLTAFHPNLRRGPQRQRILLFSGSTPTLKPDVRLQYDTVRQAWALLSPEKVLWPDEVSLDILNLCNGANSMTRILEELSMQYDPPIADITADVETFLQGWFDRSLVTL